MPNLLLLGKQYEAYVTVIAGDGGGPLVYIDHAGHIHVVPTGPDSRRVSEELAPQLKELEKALDGVAAKLEQFATAGASA
jgi:hypothetical protein